MTSEAILNTLKKIFFILLILGFIVVVLSQLVIIYQGYRFIQTSNEIEHKNPRFSITPP